MDQWLNVQPLQTPTSSTLCRGAMAPSASWQGVCFWIDYAKKQFLLKSNPKFFHDQNTFCLYTYMINFIFSVEIEIIPSRRWLLSIFKINHFSINWPQVRQAGLHPSVLPGADGGDLWKRGNTSNIKSGAPLFPLFEYLIKNWQCHSTKEWGCKPYQRQF